MRLHKNSAKAKFNELTVELLPHLRYFLDLNPSDYFLRPNLKKWFGENELDFKEKSIALTNTYFVYLDKSY